MIENSQAYLNATDSPKAIKQETTILADSGFHRKDSIGQKNI